MFGSLHAHVLEKHNVFSLHNLKFHMDADSGGVGYPDEREAIERWLLTSDSSPVTREKISKDLRVNWAVKKLMDQWQRTHGLSQVK